ncbi:unnamed protein product [Choristocarpus tenellus]
MRPLAMLLVLWSIFNFSNAFRALRPTGTTSLRNPSQRNKTQGTNRLNLIRPWISHCTSSPVVAAGARDGYDGDQSEERGLTPLRAMRAGSSATTTVAGIATAAFVAALGFPDQALAEAAGWVAPAKFILDPILLYFEAAFVARIIFSWYPALDLNKLPQNLAAWPTEPILKPTRAVVPPAFGVDISPIVWVMICSFLHEILLGQQGILNLISSK